MTGLEAPQQSLALPPSRYAWPFDVMLIDGKGPRVTTLGRRPARARAAVARNNPS